VNQPVHYRIRNGSYSRRKYLRAPLAKNKHIQLCEHKQMVFVSNGGKFKHYTVPNGLLFSTLTQPRFSFERMIFIQRCRLYFQVKKLRAKPRVKANNKIISFKIDTGAMANTGLFTLQFPRKFNVMQHNI
jgi:hypothetical protein